MGDLDMSDLAEEVVSLTFFCPIMKTLMRDPVMCADGHSYERASIELWLRTHNTSPATGAELANRTVTPNHTLRKAIEEHLERTFKTVLRSSIDIGPKIGEGSFKTVHRGTLRCGGHGITVAVLKMRDGARLWHWRTITWDAVRPQPRHDPSNATRPT